MGPGGQGRGTYFSDLSANELEYYPLQSRPLTHLNKIIVWSSNDADFPLIQGYEMQFDNLTLKNPPTIYNGSVVQSLQFPIGEYITQIQISTGAGSHSGYGISYLEITSSKGQTLFIGGRKVSPLTYKVPVGWRIVGFHGKANWLYDSRYVMTSLGTICVPVI